MNEFSALKEAFGTGTLMPGWDAGKFRKLLNSETP